MERPILELAIASYWKLDIDEARQFVQEVCHLYDSSLNNFGDIFVGLSGIEAVRTLVLHNFKSVWFSKIRRTDIFLSGRNKLRPSISFAAKLSPYLESYQRSKIKKQLKVYEITPAKVITILAYPEIISISLELYTGIEETESFIETINQLLVTKVTPVEVLKAIDDLIEVNPSYFPTPGLEKKHYDYGHLFPNYKLNPKNIARIISNPELLPMAKQLVEEISGETSQKNRKILDDPLSVIEQDQVIDQLSQSIIDFDHSKFEKIKQFNHQCWNEIVSEERRYQVPSKGRAVIITSDFLFELLYLKSVRFVQEKVNSPGVFAKLEFLFDEKYIIQEVKINSSGVITGFHSKVTQIGIEEIIDAIVLSYYRDLVLPGSVYEAGLSNGKQRQAKAKKEPSPRVLPRSQSKTTKPSDSQQRLQEDCDFLEWHQVQERTQHYVTGFRRWVREGFMASWDKRKQADEAGVKLPPGYTWVNEFTRGSKISDEVKLRFDKDGNLTEETLFSPPSRATVDLRRLLSA